LENLLKTSTKNVALEIVVCLMPKGKSGILSEIENAFNLGVKHPRREERKKGSSDTENSMANAETEEDDLSLIQNRILGKNPSKRIIFNG
jgi:hypothetical protein